ncbi:Spermidine synthase [Luteitalea pratensis]|uniref:Polyamine aminopropyltransferase n=1 Tax=Luteitalea pratensis TaxID=1855912 RepID=A0A143PHF8_LUTPR|nr:polyamine aminopropyltransferase [Luteitalea pratensis]AMY07856.1 Spermidine synthase [Luteitalea pratensis]
MTAALLASVLLIAACGLIYELVAGALASYLLGDSITQFSTVIGTYLFAMGIGSWISRFVGRGLAARFILVEIMVGVVGGFSSAALFLAFAYTDAFRLLLYVLVLVVGTLVGLEIPLLMRLLRDRFQFKDVVANVLTFDYLGALGASLLFPIVLVPKLGLVRAPMLFGAINVLVALWTTSVLRESLAPAIRRTLQATCVVALALLGVGLWKANAILDLAEANLYADEVVLSRTTPYQRIVMTAWKDDLRLFLNANLQFSSRDEYRYHEALVHPGLAALPAAARVLILGGGDGLALREVLRYRQVRAVTLVDLDPEMTRLFSSHEELRRLNGGALSDPRVRVINADAFTWIDESREFFDFAIVDFPDPSNFSLGKLYTTTFYRMLMERLTPDATFVVQSTSPLFARQAYWCIVATVEQAGLAVAPYHVYVPSFGEWGFVLAGRSAPRVPTTLPAGLRFLTTRGLGELFDFPVDMARVPVEPNRLHTQALVRYYEREWNALNR